MEGMFIKGIKNIQFNDKNGNTVFTCKSDTVFQKDSIEYPKVKKNKSRGK